MTMSDTRCPQHESLDEQDGHFVTNTGLQSAPDGAVSNLVYKDAFGPLFQRGLKPSVTSPSSSKKWDDYDIIVMLDTEYGPELLRSSKP